MRLGTTNDVVARWGGDSHAHQQGADTVVNFGHGDSLTLVGVSVTDVKDDPGHFFHVS